MVSFICMRCMHDSHNHQWATRIHIVWCVDILLLHPTFFLPVTCFSSHHVSISYHSFPQQCNYWKRLIVWSWLQCKNSEIPRWDSETCCVLQLFIHFYLPFIASSSVASHSDSHLHEICMVHLFMVLLSTFLFFYYMPQSISLAVLAVRLIEWGILSTVCVWSRVCYIVNSGCMIKSLVYSRQWVYGQEFGI